MDFDALKKIVDGLLDYSLGFGEFTLSNTPNSKHTEIIAKLRILQKKISKSNQPFLTENEIQEFMNISFSPYILWNKKIKNQATQFYNANAELARKSISKPPRSKYQPLEILMKKSDRFLKANEAVTKVLKKHNYTKIDDTVLFEFYYILIVITEAMEYPFYKNLEKGLTYFKIKGYDLKEIFSVTKKWIDEDGKYETDGRMIRNALAHFNFEVEERKNELNFIFYPNPEGKEETRKFNDREFMSFIGNYRLLLQTFHCILNLMVVFSILRRFFKK